MNKQEKAEVMLQLQQLRSERTKLYHIRQRHPSEFTTEHISRISETNAEMKLLLDKLLGRTPIPTDEELMEEGKHISPEDLPAFLAKCEAAEAARAGAVRAYDSINAEIRGLLSDDSPAAKARLSRLLERAEQYEQTRR